MKNVKKLIEELKTKKKGVEKEIKEKKTANESLKRKAASKGKTFSSEDIMGTSDEKGEKYWQIVQNVYSEIYRANEEEINKNVNK